MPHSTMGNIYIFNKSGASIQVRITSVSNSKGSESFFAISNGNSDKWDRSGGEVAFVQKGSGSAAEVLIVQPDNTYEIA